MLLPSEPPMLAATSRTAFISIEFGMKMYAMGGEVKTALNLVCFPESMDQIGRASCRERVSSPSGKGMPSGPGFSLQVS